MEQYFIVIFFAFGASLLTFFSGFGLGTILTPVFVLFFPIDIAIGLTAIVHLLNNLLKMGLIGRFLDKTTVIRFGLPAIASAIIGSLLLSHLQKLPVLLTYQFFGETFFGEFFFADKISGKKVSANNFRRGILRPNNFFSRKLFFRPMRQQTPDPTTWGCLGGRRPPS